MSEFTPADRDYMRRAIDLAQKARFSARPNPKVGCVLVSDNRVVGEGWHRKSGEAHAEINALRVAGESARGSTAFVSLEPCLHDGKTPPCTEALIDAGVARVIAAMQDPNPKVAGRGLEKLRGAGIDVQCGLMQAESEALNRGFISRMIRGRPFVCLKIAASLDGATAMASGDSQWITSEDARHDVQLLRALSGAVLTGIGTVLKDDPSLNVRDQSLGPDILQPHRIVLDSTLKMSSSAKMLSLSGKTSVFCIDDRKRHDLEAAGASVVMIDSSDGCPDPGRVFEKLAQMEINDVLVEAGPTLAGALLSAGYVDELVIYQAPHMMGSETHGMIETSGLTQLDQRIELEFLDVTRVGPDLRITAGLRP